MYLEGPEFDSAKMANPCIANDVHAARFLFIAGKPRAPVCRGDLSLSCHSGRDRCRADQLQNLSALSAAKASNVGRDKCDVYGFGVDVGVAVGVCSEGMTRDGSG